MGEKMDEWMNGWVERWRDGGTCKDKRQRRKRGMVLEGRFEEACLFSFTRCVPSNCYLFLMVFSLVIEAGRRMDGWRRKKEGR